VVWQEELKSIALITDAIAANHMWCLLLDFDNFLCLVLFDAAQYVKGDR